MVIRECIEERIQMPANLLEKVSTGLPFMESSPAIQHVLPKPRRFVRTINFELHFHPFHHLLVNVVQNGKKIKTLGKAFKSGQRQVVIALKKMGFC